MGESQPADGVVRRPRWSLPGAIAGACGYVLALRPTLLPRTSVTQALACALVAMTCYALVAIIEGLIRAARSRSGERESRLSGRTRWLIAAAFFLVAAAFTPQAMAWQAEQVVATGVTTGKPNTLLVITLTIIISLVLLALARFLRSIGRRIARWLGRHTAWPFAVRTILGGVLTFGIVAILTAAGLFATNLAFEKINNSVPAGEKQPTSTLRSGGPGSLIPWSTLGVQGRWFVQGGPTPQQISAVTGAPAAEPIRVFAGVESADSTTTRANLAVADLERAGAFKRRAVVVYTPATNGLVDPTSATAAEYVSGGDIASVSIQYTVLPSFLSLLLSQDESLDAGTVLLNTVRAAIEKLPAASRPKLYVYGESLGAFGSQGPFAGKGLAGIPDQVDGAIWAGPPANSAYWQQMNALATGGPAWQPIVADGRILRFAADAAGLAEPRTSWGPVRGVYLQNATDAVVWWSPSLISSRPAWLNQPRGPAVPAQMTWLPLITFEQVLVDLPAAGNMPAGVGHNYLPSIGPAWVAVQSPASWTPANTARLQAALR